MDHELNRRDLLAAGAAATAGAALFPAGADAGTGSGAPVMPKDKNTYRFKLSRTKPNVVTPGGTVTECNQNNFPVVKGNAAAVFFVVMKKGALREPHWHPNAWEIDVPIKGRGKLGIVTPQGTVSEQILEVGDIGFIPRGWAHYIENVGDGDLEWQVVFNNSLPDDVGLSTMFGGMPTSTFTETLGNTNLDKAVKPKTTKFIVT